MQIKKATLSASLQGCEFFIVFYLSQYRSELIPVKDHPLFVPVVSNPAGDHLDQHADLRLRAVQVGQLGGDHGSLLQGDHRHRVRRLLFITGRGVAKIRFESSVLVNCRISLKTTQNPTMPVLRLPWIRCSLCLARLRRSSQFHLGYGLNNM